MLNRPIFVSALIALNVSIFADTLELKDNASITGRVVAEKNDDIAVDVGYTILMVPRSAISKVVTAKDSKNEEHPSGGNSTPPPSAEISDKIYQNPGTLRQDRTVRELVSTLGEAVVQVRTPSGLGSGFIINEEGYLITNFHVVEGETQISIEVYHSKNGQLDRKSYKDVRIIAINKFEDMALLKIDDKGTPKFA